MLAGSREWAALSPFQSLCVSLFDQASPGPQEHGSGTSSRRTKRPLSAVSHPHLASTRPHPGTNSGRAHARGSVVGGTLEQTLKRTGRSIKHTGDTLAGDKHQHNSARCRLPQRWEKTEHTASGDKEREGSVITGH